jgi:hypothetical protein
MMVALKVDLVVHSPYRALAAWLQVGSALFLFSTVVTYK